MISVIFSFPSVLITEMVLVRNLMQQPFAFRNQLANKMNCGLVYVNYPTFHNKGYFKYRMHCKGAHVHPKLSFHGNFNGMPTMSVQGNKK